MAAFNAELFIQHYQKKTLEENDQISESLISGKTSIDFLNA